MAKIEKQKYSIGTLVQLSAAGAARHQNWNCVDGFGIITEFNQYAKYPYSSRRFGKKMVEAQLHGDSGPVFKGYEIKKLKAVKK